MTTPTPYDSKKQEENEELKEKLLDELKRHFDERTEHSDWEIDHFNWACRNIEVYFACFARGVPFRNYAGVEKKVQDGRPFKRQRPNE